MERNARSIVATQVIPARRFVSRSGVLGGTDVIGVSDNDTEIGRAVNVVMTGQVRVDTGVAIAAGDLVDTDAAGKAVKAVGVGLGVAETGAPAGKTITVSLHGLSGAALRRLVSLSNNANTGGSRFSAGAAAVEIVNQALRTRLLGSVTSVAADVPTITTSTSSPTGVTRYAPQSGAFELTGRILGYDAGAHLTTISGCGHRIALVLQGTDTFYIAYKCGTSNADSVRVSVNGHPAFAAAQSQSISTTAGTVYWTKYTFGDSAGREIELEISSAIALIGLAVPKIGTVSRPAQKSPRRMLWVTDSFGGSTSGNPAVLDAVPYVVSRLYGCDFEVLAEGGAGYTQVGTLGGTFSTASKISACAEYQPTDIIFMSGVNDSASSDSYESAVVSTIEAYKAAAPAGVRVHVVLPLPRGDTAFLSASSAEQTRKISAAAVASGCNLVTNGLYEAGSVIPPAWTSGTVGTFGQFVSHIGAVWQFVETTDSSGAFNEPGAYARYALRGLPFTGTGNAGATTADGSPAPLRVESSVQDMDGATISNGDFAGFADGYFTAGYVEWAIGSGEYDRRGIERHVGSTLQLLGGTSGLSLNQPVRAYPGCPQTVEACRFFQGNVLQFGGIPHLAGQSPFENSPF